MQSFLVMVPFIFYFLLLQEVYFQPRLLSFTFQGLTQLEVEISKSKISMLINPFDDMCIQTRNPTFPSFL